MFDFKSVYSDSNTTIAGLSDGDIRYSVNFHCGGTTVEIDTFIVGVNSIDFIRHDHAPLFKALNWGPFTSINEGK